MTDYQDKNVEQGQDENLEEQQTNQEKVETQTHQGQSEKLDLIVKTAEDKIGEEVKVIDIRGTNSIGDYFVIVTGKNKNHTQAIADEIDQKLSKAGMPPKSVEGFRDGGWILLDAGDVIVHVFTSDQREYYGLEELWK